MLHLRPEGLQTRRVTLVRAAETTVWGTEVRSPECQ